MFRLHLRQRRRLKLFADCALPQARQRPRIPRTPQSMTPIRACSVILWARSSSRLVQSSMITVAISLSCSRASRIYMPCPSTSQTVPPHLCLFPGPSAPVGIRAWPVESRCPSSHHRSCRPSQSSRTACLGLSGLRSYEDAAGHNHSTPHRDRS